MCKSIWEENQKEDPTYGTGAGKAEMDEEGDLKVRVALQNGIIKPFEKFYNQEQFKHLLSLVAFNFGRYWGVRGGAEIANLQWNQLV